MLKITAVIIIFLSCTYIGFYYGESFKKRSRQLNSILKSVLFLNNEVMYTNTPLPEALKYISLKVESPVNYVLSNVSDKLLKSESTSVYEAFEKEYKKNKSEFYLQDEDKRIVKDFLRSLGESGVYGQDKLFNLTIENMKLNCKSAEELAKKNIKMYRVLGICIGAMISIFLI
ncbi:MULTISPECIES: stage III sporulation protein SpoIIIAB [Clostridium]|uniref:Stage III sporulation protein SpoAB n=1 Tax=Clostridium sartagoforme AAU1 TaxID=1202534 RepID=R9BTJ5_9CLOT|nr:MULTISPECIES: stage III sporulation protein SpoIIIAB [Clostridium]EOR20368.1 stage III sporulation protein SpoAB [Clostridium sartagoforme AAU1]KLE16033.1 stage III sporulation protein AB [Clostridium sp. C8]